MYYLAHLVEIEKVTRNYLSARSPATGQSHTHTHRSMTATFSDRLLLVLSSPRPSFSVARVCVLLQFLPGFATPT